MLSFAFRSACARPVARFATSRTCATSVSAAAPAASGSVAFELRDGVAVVTLQDERKRNALSSAAMRALLELLPTFEDRADVRVVVLRARGHVFSAGHDLKELQAKQGAAACAVDEVGELFDLCSQVMLALRHLSCPVIAEVSGLATAAGCQLVAASDLAVAADTARFATPGVKIGLFCTTPGVAIARTMQPKHAMGMLLTGDPITADEAKQFGLVNRVVPSAELEESTLKLALQIGQASRHTVALGKRAFYEQLSMANLQEAYDFAGNVMSSNMALPDAQEGIAAFVEKRQPHWNDGR